MDTKNIQKLLEKFNWENLRNMYGSSHYSTIGFISSGWIDQTSQNTIMCSAPSPSRGCGRPGQINADILLFKQKEPCIVVEVESDYDNYITKIEHIEEYFKNTKKFRGLHFGLLVMTNIYEFPNGRRCWDIIKNKIEHMKYPMALVSIERREAKLDKSPLDNFRRLNKNFKPKEVARIDYRIYVPNQKMRSGARALHRKNEK